MTKSRAAKGCTKYRSLSGEPHLFSPSQAALFDAVDLLVYGAGKGGAKKKATARPSAPKVASIGHRKRLAGRPVVVNPRPGGDRPTVYADYAKKRPVTYLIDDDEVVREADDLWVLVESLTVPSLLILESTYLSDRSHLRDDFLAFVKSHGHLLGTVPPRVTAHTRAECGYTKEEKSDIVDTWCIREMVRGGTHVRMARPRDLVLRQRIHDMKHVHAKARSEGGWPPYADEVRHLVPPGGWLRELVRNEYLADIRRGVAWSTSKNECKRVMLPLHGSRYPHILSGRLFHDLMPTATGAGYSEGDVRREVHGVARLIADAGYLGSEL